MHIIVTDNAAYVHRTVTIIYQNCLSAVQTLLSEHNDTVGALLATKRAAFHAEIPATVHNGLCCQTFGQLSKQWSSHWLKI